ncbi:hypothetical protein ACFC3R_13590 [Enterococcus durans]|uniref:hypothetical protein n=1 Tax=Enterococcus durans TaxID=53345 RepID=UPI0039A6C137
MITDKLLVLTKHITADYSYYVLLADNVLINIMQTSENSIFSLKIGNNEIIFDLKYEALLVADFENFSDSEGVNTHAIAPLKFDNYTFKYSYVTDNKGNIVSIDLDIAKYCNQSIKRFNFLTK